MSKTKTDLAKASPAHGSSTWARTLRETVESVVIAFILAFLFRTFEAEAFVIPTGSMAPTLQGRHKDIQCPRCSYTYRTGASEEVDEDGNRHGNCALEDTTCPMCRYTLDVDPNDPANRSDYPSYNGDRIIVSKFAYELSDPQRWDVVVFKYPEDAKINYIKRLVGLPNESLQIVDGDIYTAPLGARNRSQFEIARKPPEKLRAMLQPVYDNDYVIPDLIQAGFPPRWQPLAAANQATPWKTSADYKSFQADGSAAQPAWLRYQHILPASEPTRGQPWDIWGEFEKKQPFRAPGPSLITDFYAYNAGKLSPGCQRGGSDESNWVGDLSLNFQLNVTAAQGQMILELVKGGRQFQCHIDLASGKATLSIIGLPDFAPVAQTPIRGSGNYQVSFANVDQQLLLWVNGSVIQFDSPTTFPNLGNSRPSEISPNLPGSDLSPAGIAVTGGAAVNVSHVQIWRDIFYIADPRPRAPVAGRDASTFDLGADRFLMLGDNSPRSRDSRYWTTQNYVDRKLLIGKALFIYWPHSFNYVDIAGKKIPLPFWPNFARMGFVH